MTNYYGMGAHQPEISVEIAFFSNPPADPQLWVDVTDYVLSIETRRGRNDELSQVEAGTCVISLKNWGSRFDPSTNGLTNLVANPWLASNTTGWSASSSVAVSRDASKQYSGSHSLKTTWSTGGGEWLAQHAVTLVANVPYRFGMAVYHGTGWGGDATLHLHAEGFDLDHSTAVAMNKTNEWQWVEASVSSASDLSGYIALARSGTPDDGDYCFVDMAHVTPFPGGPFCGSLEPGKRVRVRAKDAGGNEHSIWTGFIQSWAQDWKGDSGNIPVATIHAADAFNVLARHNKSFSQAAAITTGEFISDRLDSASWAGSSTLAGTDRALDAGTHSVGGYESETRNVLAAMQVAEVSEGGTLYVAGDGEVTFKDRLTRIADRATSTVTFSDMMAASEAGLENWMFHGSTYGWVADGSGVTIAWDPAVDRYGWPYSGSMKVANPNSTAEGGPRHNGEALSYPFVNVGDTIEVSVWVKADGADAVWELELHEFDDAVDKSTKHSGPNTTCPNGVWTQLVCRATPTASGTDRVRAHINWHSGELDAWVDHMQCEIVRGDDHVPISELAVEYDESRLVNQCDVDWNGGTKSFSDSASDTKFLMRSKAITAVSTTLVAGGAAAGLAAHHVHFGKDPAVRVPRISVDCATDGDNVVRDILGLDILHRVTIRKQAPRGEDRLTVDCHVEGVSHSIAPLMWRTSFDLSPADTGDTAFLVLDNGTTGRLDNSYFWGP